jgi:hypothetical protein
VTIANRLEAGNWWDSLSPADQNNLKRGRAAIAGCQTDRLRELATSLHRQTGGRTDSWEIGSLVRRLEGTNRQQRLLKEAIRLVIQRTVERRSEEAGLLTAN